jgi:phosphoribosylglycinamide formyltransferase-1
MKIAVLASDKGNDMQPLIDEIEKGNLDAKIELVISDKENAYALQRAGKYFIKAVFVNPEEKTREDFDKDIIKEIEKVGGIDLILLIGYMKILSSEFVRKYRNKIMNIHPSLLPLFAGAMDKQIHQAILKSGAKITGCSLHFVDEGVDTGPIILQKAVEVTDDDTVDTLRERVQHAEQEIILNGIKLFLEGKLKIEGKRVRILDHSKK